jgi:signal transduction histidine kinase
VPSASPPIPDEQATAVFRIFQESLTNIARHAHATEVNATLDIIADTLVLKVADNGVGITDVESTGPHTIGLAGMRERALRWDGRVEVLGSAGQGTTVVLHMPIEKHGVEPIP